jgi:hypothetical protein
MNLTGMGDFLRLIVKADERLAELLRRYAGVYGSAYLPSDTAHNNTRWQGVNPSRHRRGLVGLVSSKIATHG